MEPELEIFLQLHLLYQWPGEKKIHPAVISDKHQREWRAVLPGWDEAGQFLSSRVARRTIERVTDNYSGGKRGRKALQVILKRFAGRKYTIWEFFDRSQNDTLPNWCRISSCWKYVENCTNIQIKVYKRYFVSKSLLLWKILVRFGREKLTFWKFWGCKNFVLFLNHSFYCHPGEGEGIIPGQ